MRNLIFTVLFLFIALCAESHLVGAQEAVNPDDVQAGHKLAIIICANCHMAAPDQSNSPILKPPATPFASIAQRTSVTADWLQNYMKTTHRGLDNPNGMPDPQLLDFQIKQVSAYLLSLRKSP